MCIICFAESETTNTNFSHRYLGILAKLHQTIPFFVSLSQPEIADLIRGFLLVYFSIEVAYSKLNDTSTYPSL